jgi:hypothetical protein
LGVPGLLAWSGTMSCASPPHPPPPCTHPRTVHPVVRRVVARHPPLAPRASECPPTACASLVPLPCPHALAPHPRPTPSPHTRLTPSPTPLPCPHTLAHTLALPPHPSPTPSPHTLALPPHPRLTPTPSPHTLGHPARRRPAGGGVSCAPGRAGAGSRGEGAEQAAAAAGMLAARNFLVVVALVRMAVCVSGQKVWVEGRGGALVPRSARLGALTSVECPACLTLVVAVASHCRVGGLRVWCRLRRGVLCIASGR